MVQGSGRSEHFRGIILLLITAVLWSSGGVLIKSIHWHPLAIAGVRSVIAALVIRAAFRGSPLSWSKPQLTGAVAYSATVALFVVATKLTTAANAILLQYTAPVFVAVLGAWLLKEKATVQDWLTIAVVLGGMGLFFVDKMSPGGLLGNLMAVASGFTMALMAVCMRWQKDGSPFGSIFLGNILTFLIGLPFMLDSAPGLGDWVGLVLLGCFQLGLSYILYSMAIKHVKALEATIITVIEPILNPVWVFLLLGEVPGPWSLLGGSVILIAITARYAWPAFRSGRQPQTGSASLSTNSAADGKAFTTHQGE
ncbi:MAG: DMT family transporter [Negativicutes bacterium]|nr:DMT family transporter [Negativicutes bacterium]